MSSDLELSNAKQKSNCRPQGRSVTTVLCYLCLLKSISKTFAIYNIAAWNTLSWNAIFVINNSTIYIQCSICGRYFKFILSILFHIKNINTYIYRMLFIGRTYNYFWQQYWCWKNEDLQNLLEATKWKIHINVPYDTKNKTTTSFMISKYFIKSKVPPARDSFHSSFQQ